MELDFSMVTKKFINDPRNAVDDALAGMVYGHPQVVLSKMCPRVLLRTDKINYCRSGKVSLITGGGSGHEPFASGYVGAGMLTAAVAGSVFASPPSNHVLAALEETANHAGTILFVINYTGDRLNFGLAAERYNCQEGRRVHVLTIADDVAIKVTENRVGRRGLAGAVLVLKVAGAMAEDGKSVAEIEFVVNAMGRNMGTLGVSLIACSLPGQGVICDLKPDMMEVGLGIHGEAGMNRECIKSANVVINNLLTTLIDTLKKAQSDITSRSVIILLNNLGSVSQIEMSILQGEVVHWCHEHNVQIARLMVGTYMTSLDGHGISISLLNIFDENLLKYIDAPTDAPGWKRPFTVRNQTTTDEIEEDLPRVPEHNENQSRAKCVIIEKVLTAVCTDMEQREAELNRLDGAAGDGDCGSTFRHAAEVIQRNMRKNEINLTSAHTTLNNLSKIFETEVGGTSGALYALILSTASRNLRDVTNENIRSALIEATEAVMKYGGAQPGDRTMVDSLHAAVEASNQNWESTDWESVVTAAESAAEATRHMKAGAGRASYTSLSVQTEPDAGAKAISYWMRAAWEEISKK